MCYGAPWLNMLSNTCLDSFMGDLSHIDVKCENIIQVLYIAPTNSWPSKILLPSIKVNLGIAINNIKVSDVIHLKSCISLRVNDSCMA